LSLESVRGVTADGQESHTDGNGSAGSIFGRKRSPAICGTSAEHEISRPRRLSETRSEASPCGRHCHRRSRGLQQANLNVAASRFERRLQLLPTDEDFSVSAHSVPLRFGFL